MEVAAVQHHDVDRSFFQTLSGIETAEPTADDNNAGTFHVGIKCNSDAIRICQRRESARYKDDPPGRSTRNLLDNTATNSSECMRRPKYGRNAALRHRVRDRIQHVPEALPARSAIMQRN